MSLEAGTVRGRSSMWRKAPSASGRIWDARRRCGAPDRPARRAQLRRAHWPWAIEMAHPKGFEPLASAFGEITRSAVEVAMEREMIRYHTVSKKEFLTFPTRGYPASRSDFRPSAYVVLTRDGATGVEEVHG